MWLKIEITFFHFKAILNKGDIVHNVSSYVANVHDPSVEVVAIFKRFGVVDSIKHILIISAKYLRIRSNHSEWALTFLVFIL